VKPFQRYGSYGPIWSALPPNARSYLERIEAHIGAPIDMVSTGPDREHTILLRHPYQLEDAAALRKERTAC